MIDKMFRRLELPFPDKKIQIFSDGNDDYVYTLPEYYADTCIDYGQVIKIRENGRVVDKIKRIIFGKPNTADIETTNIENFNSILRERVGRLVRKTKCYSKKKPRLMNATELIQFHWNFMDPIHDNLTPAMIESLSKNIWSWDDFLMFHYAVQIRTLGIIYKDIKKAKELIYSIFNLKFDLNQFYESVKNDKIMSKLAKELRGLKSPTTPTVFESLVDSIVEQQISLHASSVKPTNHP